MTSKAALKKSYRKKKEARQAITRAQETTNLLQKWMSTVKIRKEANLKFSKSSNI